MATKEEINQIVDYALEKDNLAIALKIGSAYDEIRKRIIRAFIKKLENTLKDNLGKEWVIVNELKFRKSYERFYLSKRQWHNDYAISIQPQKRWARNFVIGVTKNDKLAHMQGNKLKNQLDQVCGTGLANNGWEWYGYIEGIYRDWDNEEAIIKMHTGDEAVTYFKNYINKIIEVATPFIDEELGTLNEA